MQEELVLSNTEFRFCPLCSSKKFFYAETFGEEGQGGDFNHYCKRCDSTMLLKCPTKDAGYINNITIIR